MEARCRSGGGGKTASAGGAVLENSGDDRGLGPDGSAVESSPLESFECGLHGDAVIGGNGEAETASGASPEATGWFRRWSVVLVEVDLHQVLPSVLSSSKRNEAALLDPHGLTASC